MTIVDNVGERGVPLTTFSGVLDGKEAAKVVETVAESVVEAKKNGKFEAEMEEGKYLQILETYAVNWSTEKVARDVLQNFFDGNGGTLDGVKIGVNENENGDSVVRIEGVSQYDYRKLVHLGGSSKTNSDSSVGGFGEGAKIMSLIMLRDMGIENVTFGSGDWQLKFYLNDVDEDSYDQKVRGLFAKLKKMTPPMDGNFFEFTIPKDNSSKEEYLKVFGEISDLFKHSDNPDFQNPIFENEDFGIVFLGNGDGDKGNYYDGGQRRHVGKNSWQTIQGFNMWSTKPLFKQDRDRGVVEEHELVNKLLVPMFKKLEAKDLSRIFLSLEEIWIPKNALTYGMKEKIVSSLIDALAGKGEKIVFSDQYFCDDDNKGTMRGYVESLKQKGYKICGNQFKRIGMKTISEEFNENQKHYAKEVNEIGKERIGLLMNTAERVLSRNSRLSSQLLPAKPILIFSSADEKTILGGQYNSEFTWMSEDVLGGSFSQALSIYLHELSHKNGSDESAEFSYTLTDCQTAVIDFFMNANEGEIKKIKDVWNHSEVEVSVPPEVEVVNAPPSSIKRSSNIFTKLFKK